MGCAEGRSPFAGSLRASFFLARKKLRGKIERFFSSLIVDD